MKKFIGFLVLFCCAFSSSLLAQEVSAKLENKEIKLGDQTNLHIEIRFSAASEVMFPTLKDTISKFIEIVEVKPIDTAYDEKDVTTKIFSQDITVTSFDTGFHVIKPFIFLIDGDTIKSEPTMLTVHNVQVPQDADITDIKDVMDVPFSFMDWVRANKWYILLAILVIVILFVGVYLYKKYKKRPVQTVEKAKPLEPAHLIAQRKLEKLKQKKLWQNGEIKAFHVEISYIIREYLEHRYGTNSLDETTDEILHKSQGLEMNDNERQKMAYVLTLADMAKFAKQEPVSYENEQSMKNAEDFVNSTKLEVLEKKEEEDNNEKENTKQ